MNELANKGIIVESKEQTFELVIRLHSPYAEWLLIRYMALAKLKDESIVYKNIDKELYK